MFGNGFYNPYMYGRYINTANMGKAATLGKTSSIGSLLKKFNLSGFLSGANKTLNVVNQAIPIYYQVRPMINNAKTMFKVMNAVKKTDNKQYKGTATNSNNTSNNKLDYSSNGNPTFFL